VEVSLYVEQDQRHLPTFRFALSTSLRYLYRSRSPTYLLRDLPLFRPPLLQLILVTSTRRSRRLRLANSDLVPVLRPQLKLLLFPILLLFLLFPLLPLPYLRSPESAVQGAVTVPTLRLPQLVQPLLLQAQLEVVAELSEVSRLYRKIQLAKPEPLV